MGLAPENIFDIEWALSLGLPYVLLELYRQIKDGIKDRMVGYSSSSVPSRNPRQLEVVWQKYATPVAVRAVCIARLCLGYLWVPC